MRANVGNADRVIRIIAGLVILSALFLAEGGGRWWGLVGIVPLVTGLIGWCPAYALLGLNTCGVDSARRA